MPASINTAKAAIAEIKLTLMPRCGINPATQGCKWIAIDADYKNALEDLLS